MPLDEKHCTEISKIFRKLRTHCLPAEDCSRDLSRYALHPASHFVRGTRSQGHGRPWAHGIEDLALLTNYPVEGWRA